MRRLTRQLRRARGRPRTAIGWRRVLMKAGTKPPQRVQITRWGPRQGPRERGTKQTGNKGVLEEAWDPRSQNRDRGHPLVSGQGRLRGSRRGWVGMWGFFGSPRKSPA